MRNNLNLSVEDSPTILENSGFTGCNSYSVSVSMPLDEFYDLRAYRRKRISGFTSKHHAYWRSFFRGEKIRRRQLDIDNRSGKWRCKMGRRKATCRHNFLQLPDVTGGSKWVLFREITRKDDHKNSWLVWEFLSKKVPGKIGSKMPRPLNRREKGQRPKQANVFTDGLLKSVKWKNEKMKETFLGRSYLPLIKKIAFLTSGTRWCQNEIANNCGFIYKVLVPQKINHHISQTCKRTNNNVCQNPTTLHDPTLRI